MQRLTFVSKFFVAFILLVVTSSVAAQIKREHLYKLRDRNRFEGVRTKNWKPVPGEVKLSSLVFVEDASKAEEAADSISIHFYSTVPSDLKPTVFNLKMQYFMNPRIKTFGAKWNHFTWPSRILTDIKLPIGELSGVVEGQKGKVYFPICFSRPSGVTEKSVLRTTLVPDKDMTVDVTLFSVANGKKLRTWEAQALKSDVPFEFEISGDLLTSGQGFMMRVGEKGGRQFSYQIQLFGE